MASATDIHPKVAAATIGSAVATIAQVAYESITHNTIPTSVYALIVLLVTFAAGWLAPERSGEGASPVVGTTVPVAVTEAVADPENQVF